jgi:hypothetical protein
VACVHLFIALAECLPGHRRLEPSSVSGDRVQEALRRQGAHVNRRDVGFAEQTLDDRLEIGLVDDDSVVFVVHRVVDPIRTQDAGDRWPALRAAGRWAYSPCIARHECRRARLPSTPTDVRTARRKSARSARLARRSEGNNAAVRVGRWRRTDGAGCRDRLRRWCEQRRAGRDRSRARAVCSCGGWTCFPSLFVDTVGSYQAAQ